jgi:CheY-like chemotaxis protein
METISAIRATILLVEDDQFVREVAVEILQRAGYRILQASNAAEATDLCRTQLGKIDLLLSDVIMPGKTGPELSAELRAERPNLKVVLMSGYGDSAPEGNFPDVEGAMYLAKPFSVRSLVAKLNEALGGSAAQFAIGVGAR